MQVHIPWWKRWLSYLSEQHLESTASEYNPHLHVTLNRGRLQLSADQAIYSYSDLYANFRLAFERLDFSRVPDGSRVLLLGLGLASIPEMLEKKFRRQYYYTAVEIDEVIIELASDYILPTLRSPIDIICANALTYVELIEERFDMICMDIFQDALVPADFETEEFLQRLQRLLQPGGILLFNRLAATKADRAHSQRYYQEVFHRVIPDSRRLRLVGNYMLVSPRAAFS